MLATQFNGMRAQLNEIHARLQSKIELADAKLRETNSQLMNQSDELRRMNEELKRLSITDALTGLSNRRYLEARLEEEIKRSHRNGSPMSFMMIDVDEFKPYNDNFGHTEGDRALQIVARCLRETLRGADVAVRYGGEEFSILLPQTNIKEAFLTAERVRQRVEQTEFPNRKVTVSIGVAACPPKCTLTGLVSSADKALYEAKRAGRNCVKVFEEEDDDPNS